MNLSIFTAVESAQMRENTVQTSAALQWKLLQSLQLKFHHFSRFCIFCFLCYRTAARPPGSLASLHMNYIHVMKNGDFPKRG